MAAHRKIKNSKLSSPMALFAVASPASFACGCFFCLLLLFCAFMPAYAVSGAGFADAALRKGAEAAGQGRLESAIEIYMDVLLEEPENAAARGGIRELSLKIIENERSAINAERAGILREAEALRERRTMMEKKWAAMIETAKSAGLLTAYDLYLKILYEEPGHVQALEGIDMLQKRVIRELGQALEVAGDDDAALRGFYLYCAGEAVGAEGAWSLYLKWTRDKGSPLGNSTVKDYLEAVRSALNVERVIKKELLSGKKRQDAFAAEKKIPAGAVKAAMLAVWNADYSSAMKQINEVLAGDDHAPGAEREKIQAAGLKDEIWAKYVAEKYRKTPRARAHVLRGLVQYSRNRLSKAKEEWEAALELNADDEFSKGAWQAAADLEAGNDLPYASRAPLQMESIKTGLDKIARLEAEVKSAGTGSAVTAVESGRDVQSGFHSGAFEKSEAAAEPLSAGKPEYQRENVRVGGALAGEEAAGPGKSEKEALSQKHYFRGLVRYGSMDLKGAEREWAEALKINPGHFKARRSLERVRQELGKEK